MRRLAAIVVSVLALSQGEALAFTVAISNGTPVLYLQVGNGSFSGLLASGGSPQNNSTINLVSVTVPAASVGSGTAQAMTSDSTQSNSFYDNFAFCSPPAQVYIGGFYRKPGSTGVATLSVTTAASLTNATGDTIPFTQIGWTASGARSSGAEAIPSGAFTGSTQTIGTFGANTWNESCHTFSYLNAASVASGTYTGRATYTLASP